MNDLSSELRNIAETCHANDEMQWAGVLLIVADRIAKLEDNAADASELIALGVRARQENRERLAMAAEKCGVQFFGCDTPDHLADRVIELEAQIDGAKQEMEAQHKESFLKLFKGHRAIYQAMQYKIDMLMLEYCPEEMTQEQKDNWARHQKPAGRRHR